MNQQSSVMRRLQKMDAAHNIFRSVLGTSTPDLIFEQRQLLFSDDEARLYENTANDRELAEAVLGIDFPRIVSKVELDHYTSVQSLRGILVSRAFHLRAVARNLPHDEFTTFAKQHDLAGYFDTGQSGQCVYEELSDDLFFLSLTEPGHPNENHMWEEFASRGRGVRMRLCVTPKPPADLRRMRCTTGAPTAFKRINDDLKRQLNLVYIPWGLSRICAFYLTSSYDIEMESRLLVKRHNDGIDLTIPDGMHRAWPVALVAPGGAMSDTCCGIELVGVDVGPNGSVQAVQSALAGTAYSGVPIRNAHP